MVETSVGVLFLLSLIFVASFSMYFTIFVGDLLICGIYLEDFLKPGLKEPIFWEICSLFQTLQGHYQSGITYNLIFTLRVSDNASVRNTG